MFSLHFWLIFVCFFLFAYVEAHDIQLYGHSFAVSCQITLPYSLTNFEINLSHFSSLLLQHHGLRYSSAWSINLSKNNSINIIFISRWNWKPIPLPFPFSNLPSQTEVGRDSHFQNSANLSNPSPHHHRRTQKTGWLQTRHTITITHAHSYAPDSRPTEFRYVGTYKWRKSQSSVDTPVFVSGWWQTEGRAGNNLN